MNRVSLTCGLAAMDLCWLYPWSVLLGAWSGPAGDRPLLSAMSVFGLVLLGALSTQFLGRYATSHRLGRASLVALAVVAASFAVRFDRYPDGGALNWLGAFLSALAHTIGDLTPPVLAFGVALYLWRRGVRLGSQTPSFSDVESAFRVGIGGLVAFGIVVAVSSRPTVLRVLEAQTTPYVVGFFFVSLVTLALARLESLRTRTRRLSLNTQWFGVLLLVAAAIVLLALLAGQLVSFDTLIVATRPVFDLLGAVLLLVIYAVVIPLAYIVEWLVYLVLSLIRGNPSQTPPQLLQPSDVNNVIERFFAEQVPPELLLALKAAGAAIILGIALLIVARSLSRWRATSGEADATNEERDSLWDAQRMRALLREWLRWLFRRAAPGTVLSDVGLAEEQCSQLSPVAYSTVRHAADRLLDRIHSGPAAGRHYASGHRHGRAPVRSGPSAFLARAHRPGPRGDSRTTGSGCGRAPDGRPVAWRWQL